MKTKEEIEKIVKDFMSGHEEGTFVRNKNGVLMYYTEDKQTGLNLEVFFEDLLEYALEYHASQFQQEWIPVEVRLPDTTRINFIAAKDSSDRIIFLNHKELIWYHYGIGVWFADIKMFNDKYPDLTIIAWQPVIEPQPYNPKQS